MARGITPEAEAVHADFGFMTIHYGAIAARRVFDVGMDAARRHRSFSQNGLPDLRDAVSLAVLYGADVLTPDERSQVSGESMDAITATLDAEKDLDAARLATQHLLLFGSRFWEQFGEEDFPASHTGTPMLTPLRDGT